MSKENAYITTENITFFQEKKLRETLSYISVNSPFYKEKLRNIHIEEIQTIKDLEKLPVTTKQDLQYRNTDFICVDKNKIIDHITTSGTAGKPVSLYATENDLIRLAHNEYLSFICANCSDKDIVQLMVTQDKQFMAGLAYYLGLRKLGAGIIRTGPGSPAFQWESINRYKPTVIVTIPSFIIKMIDYAEMKGIDINKTSIKSAICIGEPIRNQQLTLNQLGQRIKDKWNIKLYSTYASSEMAAAFTECEYENGGHLNPEMLIVEILNEQHLQVKDGEVGEVTITTIGVEGMPLLRFKTGDMSFMLSSPCRCGRNTPRIGPILGRKSQLIKYKGTTLYPQSFYDVLNSFLEVKNFLVEVSTNAIGVDDVQIYVGIEGKGKSILTDIKEVLKSTLRVTPTIHLLDLEELEKIQIKEMSRKKVTFIDKRDKIEYNG